MIQWGTVGEWVGGVGALIAAGVPLVLYLLERNERIAAQAESRRLREAELERLKTLQMRQVSLTIGRAPVQGSRVTVHNGSSMPIRNVVLGAIFPEVESRPGSGGWSRMRTWPSIPAGGSEYVDSGFGSRNTPLFEAAFTDDNDARWVADSNGSRGPAESAAMLHED